MIGIDTNVLVRYFAQDDVIQSAQASQFLESLNQYKQGFISVVVLIELVWVLRRCYTASDAEIEYCMTHLLESDSIILQHADAVRSALMVYKAHAKADFSDCLIHQLNLQHDCEKTVTFDQTAAKKSGMTLLDVTDKS